MSPGRYRRVLIMGLASPVGGRLAQRLELDPRIEKLLGIDTEAPHHRLQRTECLRAAAEPSLLAPVLRAARIDTVVDARPPRTEAGPARSLIAALEAASPPVEKLVLSSSAHYYGYGPQAPAFLTEDAAVTPPDGDGLRRGVMEAEARAGELMARRPGTTVTVLRFAEEVGAEAGGPHMGLLGLPALPSVLGFDPRWQLVEEHDVVAALAHAVDRDLPGAFNVAADGVLALSEIAELLHKAAVPLLPPFGIRGPLQVLRRAGLPAPLAVLDALRFGRGLDNRRFKSTGFAYRYTTREAILRLRDHQRGRALPVLQRSLQDH